MILKFLRWLGAKRPFWPIVGADYSIYMSRWWLLGGSARHDQRDADLSGPWAWPPGAVDRWIGKWLAIRLHHIAREDRGRDLHDHPFDFVSIVISGWYIERLPLVQWQDPRLDLTHYRRVAHNGAYGDRVCRRNRVARPQVCRVPGEWRRARAINRLLRMRGAEMIGEIEMRWVPQNEPEAFAIAGQMPERDAPTLRRYKLQYRQMIEKVSVEHGNVARRPALTDWKDVPFVEHP